MTDSEVGQNTRTTDSPSPPRVAARSSLVDSLRGLSGFRISKEDLKRKIVIPQYLCLAMLDAIQYKNPNAGKHHAEDAKGEAAPEAPIIVFVNSKSGGKHGPVLKGRLRELMCEQQVFDLSIVKPNEFVQYGLACLETLAARGDNCAKDTRERMRVMVAGGDGTVGWVLGSLSQLYKENRLPVPPTGIFPLGTGNDLSRSFGWGGSFPFAWKTAVKRSLYKAVTGPGCRLDTWQILVSMPAGENIKLPYSLKFSEEGKLDQDLLVKGELPEKCTCFEGVFYNYFSLGMDAQVAYGFHNLRNEKPHLANSAIANKVIYSGYSCTQGWFCTPCISDPGLRGLNNILHLYIKKVNRSKWEKIQVPSSVRAIVAVNLHNYGSGRNPWGNLKQDYLEKRGFVEAQSDDGLLEIFGLKQGWHASFVMVELVSAKHIAQATAIRLEIRGGEWRDAFLQMDGEPWKQPMDKEYSTFVEIKRVPFQSSMINGE